MDRTVALGSLLFSAQPLGGLAASAGGVRYALASVGAQFGRFAHGSMEDAVDALTKILEEVDAKVDLLVCNCDLCMRFDSPWSQPRSSVAVSAPRARRSASASTSSRCAGPAAAATRGRATRS
jgi:hypothetical protein